MTLDELFAVYNELDSVNYNVESKDKKIINFYSPLKYIDKVKQVLKTNQQENIPEYNKSQESFNWNWINSPQSEQITSTPDIKEQSFNKKEFKDLLQYLKSKEGFKSNVYLDSGGVPTIGYGFTDPEIIKKGSITEEEATELLKKDIEHRRQKLSHQIKTWDQLSTNQQNALISYGFNVGVSNWKKTQPKLLNALNEGNFKHASKYINAVKDKSGKVLPGLVKRRKEEQEWFDS